MLQQKWSEAMSLDEFIGQAEENQELWKAMRNRAEVPVDLLERLTEPVRARSLLVLLEDWCGDAWNSVPSIARLAESVPGLELRVLKRDEHLDLMDRYLTGTSRAIPVVIALDERFEEVGWWGSRPAELQAWVSSAESRAMEPADRYREVRRWYARDRGRSTLEEIVELIGGGAVADQLAEVPLPLA